MRALLLAALLVLAACQKDAITPVPDEPSPSGGSQPVAATVVAVLNATAAGGSTALVATRLDQPSATSQFAQQFRYPLRTQVTRASNRATRGGHEVYGQVVSIGCDVPPSVSVTRMNGAVVITGAPVASPHQECFAAVTTVAIVTVP